MDQAHDYNGEYQPEADPLFAEPARTEPVPVCESASDPVPESEPTPQWEPGMDPESASDPEPASEPDPVSESEPSSEPEAPSEPGPEPKPMSELWPQSLPYGAYYSRDSQPPLTTPVRSRKWPIVLFFVGLLLIGGLVVVLIRGVRVQVRRDDNGASITFSTRDAAVPELDELFGDDSDEDRLDRSLASAQVGSGATLPVGQAGEEALSYQEIYKKVIPSVVSITCSAPGGVGTGTGIVMSADGYIITNCHVIQGSYQIEVLTQSDMTYFAALVGSDEASDLAVLKVEATGLVPAEFGNSDLLEVGDPVLAIGDPLGAELRGSMTDGIVSAINRDILIDDRTLTLIQTNAALNSGNSGGPLVNIYGQVIGINTMKLQSYYTTVEGLGFAIPIVTAKPIIDELLDKGYVSGRPAIGITGGEVPDYVAAYYNIPSGIYIQSVAPGSDAQRQGLKPGDVITAADGEPVKTMDELNAIKNQYSAGDTLWLTIYRAGEVFDVGLVLMDAAQVQQ